MPPTLSMKKPHKQALNLTDMTQQELQQLQQGVPQTEAVAPGSSSSAVSS
jgi:hypothetical protein